MRAVALIDGEHYADVVRSALAELPYEFVAAVLVGGVEKLRGGEEYGVPLVDDLAAALAYEPELVVDLSDEPVLTPERRLELASRSLAARPALSRPGLRLRAAALRAVRAALAGRDRHRQADRQDRPDGPARAPAVPGPRRGRGRHGPRRSRGARADRGDADARQPAGAVQVRPPRRVGPPRDGCAGRRADDRLPSLRRRPRRAGGDLQRRRGRPSG